MPFDPRFHGRRSIRLKGYDYTQAGAYFITICTHDRVCLFGEIRNNAMALNRFGELAVDEWVRTGRMRPNVRVAEFVVMPNHIHGILVITDDGRGTLQRAPTGNDDNVSTLQRAPTGNDDNVSTLQRAPTGNIEQFGKPVSNSIPTIVRGFKSATTKQINLLRNTPGMLVWQRNYYEHVIRNDDSYYSIAEYIRANPARWPEDKMFVQ
jgi:REP element-mobilizing transposase RayT